MSDASYYDLDPEFRIQRQGQSRSTVHFAELPVLGHNL